MDGIENLFRGMRIASSGLKAERARVDVIAENIANAHTTKMPDTGLPYRRKLVHFAPVLQRVAGGDPDYLGVQVEGILEDQSPFEEIFDPGHPDADAQGVLRMPNVNTMLEMADLITAVRAYEANLRVQESFKRMAERTLRLAE